MLTFDSNGVIDLPDLSATQTLASYLAKALLPGSAIYLLGNLGAGKTTLVRGILNALGHTGSAKSPTYTLVESYDFETILINHFDLYRVTDPIELEFIGIREFITPKTVNIFEWAENGGEAIPAADLEIHMDLIEHKHKARLKANTQSGQTMLKNILQNLRVSN